MNAPNALLTVNFFNVLRCLAYSLFPTGRDKLIYHKININFALTQSVVINGIKN